MEQTAVEWLINQMIQSTTMKGWIEIFDKAKEMEKKQIEDAMDICQRTDFYVKYESSEQYYNQTYNK